MSFTTVRLWPITACHDRLKPTHCRRSHRQKLTVFWLSRTTAIDQKWSVESDTFRYRHCLCNVLETSCSSPRVKSATMLHDTRYPML
ncbi:hypothetical protein D3C75_590140 [compost metagenome]